MTDVYFNTSIQATLTTTSPMLLGDGQTGASFDLKSCIDNNNCFYIPGATLKGSLANLAARIEDQTDQTKLQALFGAEKDNSTRATKAFIAGKVRFLDAISTDEVSKNIEQTITRNSIDPITRTAKEHHLFTQHQVKVGTQFKIELQLERATKQQLEQLLGLLVIWPQQALGRNTNNGQGQFELSNIRAFATNQQELQTWLGNPASTQPSSCEITSLLCNFYQTKNEFVTVEMTLVPFSPIFSTDHQSKQEQLKNKTKDENLLIHSLCQNGTPIILGSSFKGAIKAQAKRIYHTVTNTYGIDVDRVAEEFLSPIFGSEKQSAQVRVCDFKASQPKQIEQNFIAVDRFTGAVKNGANYNLLRYEASGYKGKLEIDKRLLESNQYHPQLAILVMLLRDLHDGEIKIGAFQAKGFGCVKANLSLNQTPISNWLDFCKHWDNNFSNTSIPQLEAAINEINQGALHD